MRTLDASLRAGGFRPRKMSYYNALLLPLAIARKFIHRLNGGGEHHLEDLPRPLNAALRSVLSLEGRVIRRRDLLVGASLITAAHPVAAPASVSVPPAPVREAVAVAGD
jgi:hypothetical protein